MLLQTALELQLWVPSLHSLMSEIKLINNSYKLSSHSRVLDIPRVISTVKSREKAASQKVVIVLEVSKKYIVIDTTLNFFEN